MTNKPNYSKPYKPKLPANKKFAAKGLTDKQVMDIYTKYHTDPVANSQPKLAEEYGIAQQRVSQIISNPNVGKITPEIRETMQTALDRIMEGRENRIYLATQLMADFKALEKWMLENPEEVSSSDRNHKLKLSDQIRRLEESIDNAKKIQIQFIEMVQNNETHHHYDEGTVAQELARILTGLCDKCSMWVDSQINGPTSDEDIVDVEVIPDE